MVFMARVERSLFSALPRYSFKNYALSIISVTAICLISILGFRNIVSFGLLILLLLYLDRYLAIELFVDFIFECDMQFP